MHFTLRYRYLSFLAIFGELFIMAELKLLDAAGMADSLCAEFFLGVPEIPKANDQRNDCRKWRGESHDEQRGAVDPAE